MGWQVSVDCYAAAEMGWSLNTVATAWGKIREVYLSLGLDEGVARVDVIIADSARALREPTSWSDELTLRLAEVGRASVEAARAGAPIPLKEVAAMYEHGLRLERERMAVAVHLLATDRGRLYTEFFLWAQIKLKDGGLSSVAGLVPQSVMSAVGPEHDEGQTAAGVERRVRQLAEAITTTMEGYYKPLLKMVWHLSAQVAKRPTAKVPPECGRLMDQCEVCWRNDPHVPRIDEFLDRRALQVRNGAAHRALGYDSTTSELIIKDDKGAEIARLTEGELRKRLEELMARARTMYMCFLFATGRLETSLFALSDEVASVA